VHVESKLCEQFCGKTLENVDARRIHHHLDSEEQNDPDKSTEDVVNLQGELGERNGSKEIRHSFSQS
jgi:hypothetical protein